ncbi:MAG: protein translocase subunit SecF, partial [Sulfurimonas sp.]
MEFFKYTKPFGFMGKSKFAAIISIVMILASYAVLATKGLNYGVDFAGGTIVQVKYDTTAPIDEMRAKLEGNEVFNNASITEFGSPDEVVIRLKTTTGSVTTDIGDLTREALQGTGNFEVRRVDIVGPKVGNELREKGIMAMLLAIAGILVYVAFRFEWRFAVASIVALIHDVSIALGAVSLSGIDVNLDVLAALLTLLGYSLNDTIIVFDRIRENFRKMRRSEPTEVMNNSITQTLSRTLITSATTLFVVIALFVEGGPMIHGFALALLLGITVGTYSSIYVASA